jgi:DNA-binding MarR family transcriptional regulator
MPRIDRAETVLGQIFELVVLLNEDIERSFEQDGLTKARAKLIWELHQRGPSTQAVLAAALGVSARTITGLVDGLEESGHVSREPHPSDRRAFLVTLTDLGADVGKRFQSGFEELATGLFAGMSDRRLGGLANGLSHVLDRLRTMIAAAGAESG